MEIYTIFIDWKTQFFKVSVFHRWFYRIHVVSFKTSSRFFFGGGGDRNLQVDFRIYIVRQVNNLKKKKKNIKNA